MQKKRKTMFYLQNYNQRTLLISKLSFFCFHNSKTMHLLQSTFKKLKDNNQSIPSPPTEKNPSSIGALKTRGYEGLFLPYISNYE